MWQYNYSPELYHHGIKGQKWGIRRFQNPDGTLTLAGKRRYERLGISIDTRTRKADIKRAVYADRRRYKRDVVNYHFNKVKDKAEYKGNTKKAEKVKKLQNKFNKIYDSNTRSITLGVNDVKKAKVEYLKLKQKSIKDPSIRNSEGYKKARKMFIYTEVRRGYYGDNDVYRDAIQDRIIGKYTNKVIDRIYDRKKK